MLFSFKGGIRRNVAILSIATICSKLIGFLREVISAQKFGLSDDFDIYLSVFVIPSLITSLLLYAVPNIVIPKLKLNGNIDNKGFYNYFSSRFFYPYILILVLIVILYNICLPIYIDYLELSESKYILAIKIGRLLSLYVLFEALFNILTVSFNAREKFFAPAFLHLTLQISVIISLILYSDKVGILAIGYGLAIGGILEFLFFIFLLIKEDVLKYFVVKISYVPNLISTSIVIIVVEFMGQLYSLADRMYVSEIPSGYITGLYYANILKELPFVILGVSLGGVLLPKFTQMYQNGEQVQLMKLVWKLSLKVFLLATCVVLFLIYCGSCLITILFERGAFTVENTILTSKLLSLYSVGLPFIFIHFLLVKFYYSIQASKIILITTFLSILFKFILNYCFVLNEYYEGMALSTSLAFILNSSLLIVYGVFIFSSKLKIK